MTDLESLEGLETLRLLGNGTRAAGEGIMEMMDELFGIIAPTLKALYLAGDYDIISPYLSTLPLLTLLDLDSRVASAPILLNLPPSLRHLHLRSDFGLVDILLNWDPAPKLYTITIDTIEEPEILEFLPPHANVITNYSRELLDYLRGLILTGSSGFLCDSIEVRFREKDRRYVRAMWKVCLATRVELLVDIPEEQEAEEAASDGGDSASEESSCDEDPMEDDSAEAGLSELLAFFGHGQSSPSQLAKPMLNFAQTSLTRIFLLGSTSQNAYESVDCSFPFDFFVIREIQLCDFVSNLRVVEMTERRDVITSRVCCCS